MCLPEWMFLCIKKRIWMHVLYMTLKHYRNINNSINLYTVTSFYVFMTGVSAAFTTECVVPLHLPKPLALS